MESIFENMLIYKENNCHNPNLDLYPSTCSESNYTESPDYPFISFDPNICLPQINLTNAKENSDIKADATHEILKEQNLSRNNSIESTDLIKNIKDVKCPTNNVNEEHTVQILNETQLNNEINTQIDKLTSNEYECIMKFSVYDIIHLTPIKKIETSNKYFFKNLKNKKKEMKTMQSLRKRQEEFVNHFISWQKLKDISQAKFHLKMMSFSIEIDNKEEKSMKSEKKVSKNGEKSESIIQKIFHKKSIKKNINYLKHIQK